MELTLLRKWKKTDYTIGQLYVGGVYFCDTLEDKVRELGKDGSGKIKGITAIPAGRYQIIVSRSPRFKRDLPYLCNVPFFEGIRIHSGNTAKDTEGCILVGKNKKKGMVLNSREWETKLTTLLKDYIAQGDKIYITIK